MVVNVDDALPAVRGFGGELNQVWANLIDNALDAVGQGGHVELKASREGDSVVVRVIDNGARHIRPIFETESLIRFLRQSQLVKVRDSALISHGGWCNGIMGRSNWTRTPAARNFE